MKAEKDPTDMMILKALFKVVLKWLFTVLGAAEETLEVTRNGKHRTLNKLEVKGEQIVEDTLENLKKSISEFEESLKAKAGLWEETKSPSSENADQVINDLRAELAELKSDLRVMKRILVERSESSTPN